MYACMRAPLHSTAADVQRRNHRGSPCRTRCPRRCNFLDRRPRSSRDHRRMHRTRMCRPAYKFRGLSNRQGKRAHHKTRPSSQDRKYMYRCPYTPLAPCIQDSLASGHGSCKSTLPEDNSFPNKPVEPGHMRLSYPQQDIKVPFDSPPHIQKWPLDRTPDCPVRLRGVL